MGISLAGLASGMDTQGMIRDMMKVHRVRVDRVVRDKTRLQWKKEAWAEMNKNVFGFYKKELFAFKSKSTYRANILNSSNESLVKAINGEKAPRGSHHIEIKNMAKGSFLTGGQITKAGVDQKDISAKTKISDLIPMAEGEVKTLTLSADGGATTKEVSIDAKTTLGALAGKLKGLDMDVTVGFDSKYDRFFINSKNTGEEVQIAVGGDEALLNAIGFTAGTPDASGVVQGGNRMGTKGTDAKFLYNGTELTSESNEVDVNGLKFNILADTGEVDITVTQDNQAIYDKVKDFISKYNEIIGTIQEKYDAPSARGFDPPTKEEKAAISEKDAEELEKRIKDSLFRRDDELMGIKDAMRAVLSSNRGVDTKDFKFKTLSDLGIVGAEYKMRENGKLHIKGDEDDDLFPTAENKLMKAIEDDPEAVEELMTALGNELYDKLGDMMKSTKVSSALTFYNDKTMTKELGNYEKKIKDMEKRMAEMEQRYYKQFTAMEQAIQKSQSTGDWLSKQLAGL